MLLVIILLFFGAKRVPELARSLGVGARELKKAAAEDDEENSKAVSEKNSDQRTTKAVPEDARSEGEGTQAERDSRTQ